jgi:hypothetical protein
MNTITTTNPTFSVDLEDIHQKKQTLERIKEELKQDFVGIDAIIDELINYIQIWYLMPEVLNRPIIVNLWGMTGVGKTDLVRRLVSKLSFQDRFVEVELSNGDVTSWRSSVANLLEDANVNDGKPAIVLFDEIQRFYTIDTDGKPLETTKFTDFWELLSDGKLAKREKDDLDYYINEFLFSSKQAKKRKDKNEEAEEEDWTSPIGLYQANYWKKILNIEEDVLSIAEMTREELIGKMQAAKKHKKVYEPISHAKTLILISGNLDEAFTMADEIAESDIDADIFHAYTKKITVVDIKQALARKFKPEQVARFGNIHLIYRSLQRKDFEKLITKEIQEVIDKTKKIFNVTLQVSTNINQLIYQNGVFPVQGVRPVFSSVTDILETNLSQLLFEGLLKGFNTINIDYDFEKKKIIGNLSNVQEVEIPYEGRIDKIRQGNVPDVVANVSVHEAGHAVAYVILFGLAPLQLKSKVASNYASGFTFPHQIYHTRKLLVDKIKVYLAGGIAEEIIFGKNNATIGREHDRESATALALDYVRKYGFDEEFQAYYMMQYGYSMQMTVTDTDVEKMISRLVSETHELLTEHKAFLLNLSKSLYEKGSLTAEEIAQMAAQHEITATVKEEGYLYLFGYQEQLEKFGKK